MATGYTLHQAYRYNPSTEDFSLPVSFREGSDHMGYSWVIDNHTVDLRAGVFVHAPHVPTEKHYKLVADIHRYNCHNKKISTIPDHDLYVHFKGKIMVSFICAYLLIILIL